MLFKRFRRTLTPWNRRALSAMILFFPLQHGWSQEVKFPLPLPPATPFLWKSDHARHLLGLIESAPNKPGTLALSRTGLIFTTPAAETTIERAHVVAVSAGDVRIEKGGTAGKIGRRVIPFGGGSVLATVTQAQVDLLTVEFRDAHDAYHGAVFLLPKSEALNAVKLFGSPEVREDVEEPHPACTEATAEIGTIKLAPIAVSGPPVPIEYKVLLYEQLIGRMQKDVQFGQIYRDGDRSPIAACPTFQLSLTLKTFSKGNAAVRASTGPLGNFLGVTSIGFHVHLVDYQGKILLDRDLKESERGDSDSLDIANKIAKSVTKKLKKTAAHHKAEAS